MGMGWGRMAGCETGSVGAVVGVPTHGGGAEMPGCIHHVLPPRPSRQTCLACQLALRLEPTSRLSLCPGLVIFSFLVVEPQDIGFLPQSGSVLGSEVRGSGALPRPPLLLAAPAPRLDIPPGFGHSFRQRCSSTRVVPQVRPTCTAPHASRPTPCHLHITDPPAGRLRGADPSLRGQRRQRDERGGTRLPGAPPGQHRAGAGRPGAGARAGAAG